MDRQILTSCCNEEGTARVSMHLSLLIREAVYGGSLLGNSLAIAILIGLVILGIGWCFLKRKNFFRLLYLITMGMLTITAIHFSNKLIPISDSHFYIKILLFSIGLIVLIGVVHCTFMKLVFDKDNK